MKKVILGTLALGMCLTLTACGTPAKTDATISTLSNQLDHTANIISSVQTVSPTQITAENMNEYASMNAGNAQNSLTNEEYYKLDILNKAAIIKNNLSGLKLSKAQKFAVRDLTDDLSKYTNSVSNSKSELSTTLKAIESLKKNYTKNEDRITAKLNRLISNSNARLSYYQNILNTLSQLQQLIKTDSGTQNPSNLGVKIADVKDVENKENTPTQTDKEDKSTKTTLQKNIDTYLPETKCPECGEKVNGKVCPNCGKEVVSNQQTNPINNPVAPINNMPINNGYYYNNANPANPYKFNSNNINHAAYPYGNYGYYGANFANNGIYNNGYNGIYNNGMYNNGFYNNAGIFNPNRNTDTYAPYMRNIDTYKGFGYGENMNGNATFANLDEDKEIKNTETPAKQTNKTNEKTDEAKIQIIDNTDEETSFTSKNLKFRKHRPIKVEKEKQAKAHREINENDIEPEENEILSDEGTQNTILNDNTKTNQNNAKTVGQEEKIE